MFSLYTRKTVFGSIKISYKSLTVLRCLRSLSVVKYFFINTKGQFVFYFFYFIGEPMIRNYVSLSKNNSPIHVRGLYRQQLLSCNPTAIYIYIYKKSLIFGDFNLRNNNTAYLLGFVY